MTVKKNNIPENTISIVQILRSAVMEWCSFVKGKEFLCLMGLEPPGFSCNGVVQLCEG